MASDGGFALVDRFGVVLGHVATRPAGMVLLATAADPDSLRGSPAVGAAVTVLRQLPPPIRRLVRAGGRAVAGRGDAGPARRDHGAVGRHRPAAAKAAELEILMRTKASSYDLSDPNTAVTGG